MLMDVVEYGQALGLDMSYGDHEDAPGQLELNFRFDRPGPHRGQHHDLPPGLRRGRPQARPAARRFMPKPFTGVSANGHHHHFTLIDDEGNNVFHDPDGPAQLSEIARHFLGGMLDHFPALMCVGNPTVNSYCRMWDTGFWAPIYKNWGWQNRTTTVRVASGGRFEYRGVDSSCNPYLTVAALLRAGLDGIRSKIDPGEPQQGNTYDLLAGGRGDREGARTRSAPRSRRSPPTRSSASAMPGRLYKVFNHYKRDEWERYLAAVTDWERDEYLEVLPVAMCGIAGIIYRDGERRRSGRDMTRDAPVDEAPRARLDRLRALRAAARRTGSCASSSPTPTRRATSSSHDRLRRHRGRGRAPAARGSARRYAAYEDATEYAFDGARSTTTATSRRSPTASRTSAAPRCSRSATRCRSSRTSATPRRSPATTSSTASSARHAIGHVRMATESDVDISGAHPYWAYPFSDVAVVHNGQLTNYHYWRRRLERSGPPLPVRVRLGDHRRLPRRADGRGRRRSRTRCARASRSSTACSPTSA